VLLGLDDTVRRERIRRREGAEFANAWHAVWDEAEAYYFTHICPPAAFDIVFTPAARDDTGAHHPG
jgi:hypothetical protein